jgi:hypothetical protein
LTTTVSARSRIDVRAVIGSILEFRFGLVTFPFAFPRGAG